MVFIPLRWATFQASISLSLCVLVTCYSFPPSYALSMFPFLLFCLCIGGVGRNIDSLHQWNGLHFYPFIVGLVPCPSHLFLLCMCSLSCYFDVQRGVARNANPRHHQYLFSFLYVNSEHCFFPSLFLLFLLSFLCVVHAPLPVVVVFIQGREGRSIAPPPGHQLGFLFCFCPFIIGLISCLSFLPPPFCIVLLCKEEQ